MKKFFYILLAFSLVFTSCKKEELKPTAEVVEEAGTTEEGLRIYGKYVLLSGEMYVTNLETNEKTSYDHFDANKTTSSLRYSGSEIDFEDLEQGVTTWAFYQPNMVPGFGEFVLNEDTLNPMGFYVTKSDWTIMEHPTATSASDMQLGGSARPIEGYVDDYDSEIVVIYVQDAYESIDGYNCSYYSALKFQKIEEW
jgi:hypothetical protein